jgi:hypothetical protein
MRVGFLLSYSLCCSTLHGQPALGIHALDRQNIQISWPGNATGFVLEQTTAVGLGSTWQPVNLPPVAQNERLSLALPITSNARQFFRLRQPGLTTITETSPADGETDVAVTRETIVHFSGPLAASAVIHDTNFYAVAAGRRILSRVELSTDRTKASLFYLEPLPGSSRVTVFFDGQGLADSLDRPLDPAGTGSPYSLKVISFDTLSLAPLTGTAVRGTVYASELVPGPDSGTNAVNKPLAGVTITVDGMEQNLRAVTDASGNFVLSPVPSGRFFVHIDGRTASDPAAGIHYPDMAFYPFVGKAWEAIAGRTDNLAGGTGKIYLPLITAGTLQPVSLTQDTTIFFPASVVAGNPALAGVSITVPANSLFSDDGMRGGKVGIAPVPPDRLPGPLPAGLEMPIVITVQTDGPLNFDRPAPVCFPNLPDPVLGVPLPAGTQQALISFNHKRGLWEAVGSMTVSPDGKMVCSDPGMGILQPGWHGVGPLPEKPAPPCANCCPSPTPTVALAALNGLEQGPPGGTKCNKPCNGQKNFLDCLGDCQKKRDKKGKAFIDASLKLKAHCQDLQNTKGATNSLCLQCWALFQETAITGRQKLYKEFNRCLDGCRSCSSVMSAGGAPPGGFEPASPKEPGSVADQIIAIFNQIIDLTAGAVSQQQGVPQSDLDQAAALEAQADSIVGGSAVDYLLQLVIAAEQEDLQTPGTSSADLGNAPPYSISYAATILRKDSGLFFLRDQTEPFGNYAIFVPRDGTLIKIDFYDPKTKSFGTVYGRESSNLLPPLILDVLDATDPDSDHDGLPDVVESIYGTDPYNPDTFGLGITDGQAVELGLIPLGTRPTQTGLVANTATPGPAVDVCAANDLIATAEGGAGVSIFNAFDGTNPTIIAQLATIGEAQRVVIDGSLLIVAEDLNGVEVFDLSTPASPRFLFGQVQSGAAQAVVAARGVAYVANLDSIVSLDFGTGLMVDQVSVTNTVHDLALAGDYLYALTDDRLYAISLVAETMTLEGSAASPYRIAPNSRLFVGGGLAYAVHATGYNTFDLSDPAHPALISQGNTTQLGWKQIVSNGSGLGVAAVGANFLGPIDVSLYDLSSPTNNNAYVTTFPLPASAHAVAIYNGVAYAASDAGLQVINYLAYDSKKVPPTITLSASFALDSPQVRESSSARLTANATDDVQVRNVEFYVDGAKVFSDGNFPFEYRFVTPELTGAKTNFTLQARAIDTGDNATWSELITVGLSPDLTPLGITQINPRGYAPSINSVSISFNKPVASASLTSSAVQLLSAGPDGVLGTADDVLVTGGSISGPNDPRTVTLAFGSNLAFGKYRLIISTGITDRYGAPLARAVTNDFQVIDAVYWVNPRGGNWSNPQNWSKGNLPQATDDVLIATPLPTLITHRLGNDSIKSLVSDNPILLSGGRLSVSGTLQPDHMFQISGQATLAGATILPGTGPAGSLSAAGGTLDHVILESDLVVLDDSTVVIAGGLTIDGRLILGVSNGVSRLLFSAFPPDPQILTGTGQLVFAGTPNANTLDVRVPLTIDTGLTLRGGSGTMDTSLQPLTNKGVIRADSSGTGISFYQSVLINQGLLETRQGGLLSLGSEGSWTNRGTIRVSQGELDLGGTFKIADIGVLERTGGTVKITGTLDNTGTVLSLNGTTGPWVLAGGAIHGGHVTFADGASLEFLTGIPGTLDGTILDSDWTIPDGATVAVAHGLTVNGVLTLAATNGLSRLLFEFADLAPQTLGGTGQVLFAGSGQNLLDPRVALTIGAGLTVHGGSGTVGDRSVPLVNQGTILSDLPGGSLSIAGGSLTNQGTIGVSQGATVTLDGAWVNTGTIRLTQGQLNLRGSFTTSGLGDMERNGGVLNLIGTLDNTGATVALNAVTGPWVLAGGTIHGGHVTFADGSLEFLTGIPGTLDGTILDSDWTIPDGATVAVAHGLTVNGVLTLAATNGLSRLFFELADLAAQTLGGTGQVLFAGTGGQNLLDARVALTIGAGLTIHGGSGTVGYAGESLINQGVIAADIPGKDLDVLGSSIINNGILKADGPGTTLTVRASPFTNNGTTQELNGGRVLINP